MIMKLGTMTKTGMTKMTTKQIKLKVWDESSGNWHEDSLSENDSFGTYSTDLSPYISNTTELANFTVKLEVTGAGSGNNFSVDYMVFNAN